MASLTIRQLDDDVKRRLRLRAARHGRSMEEEARHLLALHLAADPPMATTPERPTRAVAEAARVVARKDSGAPEPGGRHAGLSGKRILLIIGGGIAAYKSLDLIRRLKERGTAVRVVMTRAAQGFVTPLAAGAIAGERVHTDLFDARTESDLGHIRLARDPVRSSRRSLRCPCLHETLL